MTFKVKICVLGIVFLLIAVSPVLAAIKSSKSAAAAGPEAAFNPHPDSKDLELPMPNGLKLVLRYVPIFSSGPLDDQQFKMGLRNFDENRVIYERQMPGYIGSPLRQDNFPQSWRNKFPADEKDKCFYYLIGKYELSNGQWAAVMGGEADGRPELPKTNISWYDIQDFLRKYNEWLLKNHPDAVPAIDGAPAYVRVPTEAEWEYAARWGNPEEQQINPDFPGLGDEQKVEDFAVFGLRYDDKMPIGSRLPNKLGIYDMAGNAAELVRNGFRFPVADRIDGVKMTRMHGSEGGILRKGGSYQAKEETEVYPGRREEMRMFEKLPDNTFVPHKTGTLGVRLVLASANVPGPKRENMVLEHQKRLGNMEENAEEKAPAPKVAAPKTSAPRAGESLVSIDQDGDLAAELEKIYEATKSPLVKSNLQQYRELVRANNEALNRETDANLKGQVRDGAYKADSLSNIAYRCYYNDHKLGEIRKLAMARGQKVKPDVENGLNSEIRRHFKNLHVATNIYREAVEKAAIHPKEVINGKVLQLKKEHSDEDPKIFLNHLDNFASHVDFARKNGINKLDNVMIWKQVIPAEGVRVLVINLEKDRTSGKKLK